MSLGLFKKKEEDLDKIIEKNERAAPRRRININKLISQHRENVIERQGRKTARLERQLQSESRKTSRYSTFNKRLQEQKQRQAEAKKLQTQLKSIRNKSRDMKISKLKKLSVKSGKAVGRGIVATGKTVGQGLKTLAVELKRQQDLANAREKRSRLMERKKKALSRKKPVKKRSKSKSPSASKKKNAFKMKQPAKRKVTRKRKSSNSDYGL